MSECGSLASQSGARGMDGAAGRLDPGGLAKVEDAGGRRSAAGERLLCTLRRLHL